MDAPTLLGCKKGEERILLGAGFSTTVNLLMGGKQVKGLLCVTNALHVNEYFGFRRRRQDWVDFDICG